MSRLHQGNMLPATLLLVAGTRQQNCCQFVARLLLDTKGYMLLVAGNTLLLRATCCSSGNILLWYKRGLTFGEGLTSS